MSARSPAPATHGNALAPSPWVLRWGPVAMAAVSAAPGRGRDAPVSVLDLACGGGRHVRWFADQGCSVTAVDRDAAATQALHRFAEVVVADVEAGAWPLAGRRFDIVLVTNYLWRALWPAILASVEAHGWLIYETFGIDQARIGRPANPDFLLQPGELLDVVRGTLRVAGYEEGLLDAPPRFVQRIAAVRTTASTAAPALPTPPRT